MTHLTYKTFQKKHPKIFARAQQEVRDFYTQLGVQIQYGYRRFELPTEAIVEGSIVSYGKLQQYAKAVIPEPREVDL